MAENPFADLIPARRPLEVTIPGPNRSVAQRNPFADLVPQQRANATAKRDFGPAPTKTDSFVVGATDAATFGFGDEILGAIDAAMEKAGGNPEAFWDLYAKSKQRADAFRGSTQEENPGTYLGGQLAGGLGTAALPAGQIVRGATLGTKVLRGSIVGAGYGGLYGVGSGEGLEGRVEEGLEGAAYGGLTGAALAPVAAGIGKVAGKIKESIANRALAREAGVNKPALQSVARAFKQDLDTGSLRRAQSGDMLMNLGPQLRASAESIATQPGRGSNVLIDAARKQASDEGSRIKAVLDREIGTDAGRVINANTVEAERKAAGKLYDVARAAQGQVDPTPARQALQAVLDETDGSVRATVLKTARKLKAFTSDGPVTPATLHAARIDFDNAMRKSGTGPQEKAFLGRVRSAIDDVLKEDVPGYRQADEAYSAALASKDALTEGRNVFTRAFGSPEELEVELAAMAPATRNRFLMGARDAITTLMGTARNDAAAVRRELFEKGWNAEKLAILIGPDRAKNIGRVLEASANRAAGRNALEGNSRTAMRQAGQQMFPAEITDSGLRQQLNQVTAAGATLNALVAIANRLTGNAATKMINRNRARVSEGGARLLSATGGMRDRVVQILDEAQRAKGSALTAKERVEAVVNALGFSGAEALPAR